MASRWSVVLVVSLAMIAGYLVREASVQLDETWRPVLVPLIAAAVIGLGILFEAINRKDG
jgi:hypothetical protein